MARRGVFELNELVLKYSVDGGSSRGVREFVEHNLVEFARKNPHITIRTIFNNGHPFIVGRYGTLELETSTPAPRRVVAHMRFI
jgi:large subunit ribosomal protein L43